MRSACGSIWLLLQVRAQCLIVRHLPFLVFGTSDKDLVNLHQPVSSATSGPSFTHIAHRGNLVLGMWISTLAFLLSTADAEYGTVPQFVAAALRKY